MPGCSVSPVPVMGIPLLAPRSRLGGWGCCQTPRLLVQTSNTTITKELHNRDPAQGTCRGASLVPRAESQPGSSAHSSGCIPDAGMWGWDRSRVGRKRSLELCEGQGFRSCSVMKSSPGRLLLRGRTGTEGRAGLGKFWGAFLPLVGRGTWPEPSLG